MEPVWTAIVASALSWFKVMGYDVRVTGEENIPATGGAVLATNHIGYMDFVFSGYAAHLRKRKTRFLAKREIWDNKAAAFVMKHAKHIPVDRSNDPAQAFAAGVDALKRGELIGMFPESTISTTFVPKPAKTGAVRMAQMAGVPLIPGAIWGSHRILTKGQPRNVTERKIPIVVNIGTPLDLAPDDDPHVATKALMERITELLTEAQSAYPDS
ncbi:MAG: lysophospholipid acyltransferase family protein [Actinomycetota bacterium]